MHNILFDSVLSTNTSSYKRKNNKFDEIEDEDPYSGA